MDDRLEREAALQSLSTHSEELVRSCKENVDMLEAFEELEIITEDEKDDANDSEDYSSVMDKLRAKVEGDPSFFESFCQHIKKVDELENLADNLLGTSSAIITGQSAVTLPGVSSSSADHQFMAATGENGMLQSNTLSPNVDRSSVKSKIDGPMKRLREQLIALQSIPSESEKAKESKVEMNKTAMKSFITTSLDMGIEVHIIQRALENLHTKDTDIVIDGDTYQWCKAEIQKQNAVRNPESSTSSLEQTLEEQPFSEVNFGEVAVQNSLLACHLLDCSELKSASDYLIYPHSLSEVNKSDLLSLTGKEEKGSQPENDFLESCTGSDHDIESSTSDSKLAESSNREIPWPLLSPSAIHSAPVHQYLIAKGETEPDGHVIYYMAFSSHQSLKEWSCGHVSFEEGFRKQLEQLPIQFILERLWEGASVVLTGFSFGGILAHLCATHLWSLSQGICPELLEKNLLCITFGQPIIPLPRAKNFSDRVADKSRFHAIYVDDDIIPRMLRYLDPTSTKLKNPTCSVPEKYKSKHNPEKNFQNELSTSMIEQLEVIQDSNDTHVHTSMQRVVHHLERRLYQTIDAKLGGHPTSERMFQQFTRRRYRNSDGPKSVLDALQDLRGVLQHVKRHRSNVIPCHVTFHKVGSTLGLVECKNSDFEFPTDEEIKEDMFHKHNTEYYLSVILKHYVMQSSHMRFDRPEGLSHSDFISPTLKRLEIHHFSHHKTAALSLEGDNLCFTYKVMLYLHKSAKEYRILVDQKESISSRSIQKHQVPLALPEELVTASDGNDYQEVEETANICLFTHFGEYHFNNVQVKHKKFYISCRKQQVANLSIAEVVELSFLGALLERYPHGASISSPHTSKRFKMIQDFLKSIVGIVPIESAFCCIASTSSNRNASHLCRTLKRADIRPPLSQSFFINAGLAITKLRGETVQFDQTTTLEDLFHVFVAAAKKRAAFSFLWFKASPHESKYLKWFGPDVASNSGENFDTVKYLQETVEEAINDCHGRIPAVSGISVKSLFGATEKLSKREGVPKAARLPGIKSPRTLLKEGRSELLELQTNTRETLRTRPSSARDAEKSSTKAHNARLLDYVNRLRNEELHMCIQIITAFMEEYVRIPVSDYNLTVSYWQLLKLGLGIFRRKVSKNISTQYVSVSRHIRSIADETGHTVPAYETKKETDRDIANSKYAGKLQFLLSSSLRHDEPILIDDKFLVYSLESHLYWKFANSTVPEHQQIDNSTPLEVIEENWEMLFKDIGLSTIVPSHRRLIARWLKFSLAMHKLRTELSCHTSVGVVGLVNSGKSTLVKELFQIMAIETGTREEKRTTVPFIYGIKGVENFDVIDFPGVDDQDDSISDLVNLLRTLAQLVVFVVNYRNAHTGAAIEWCNKLNQYAIPHLVCLTHGDRLYAECADEEKSERDPAYAKRAIKKEVEGIRKKIMTKASDSPLRTVDLYSLKVDNDSLLKCQEGQQNIRDAGIKGVKDVGKWIVEALEEHLKEKDTARVLQEQFETSWNR